MKAIKTFSECPIDKRPPNVPLNYIWFFQDTDLEQLEGFTIITESEFNSIISEQDSWFAQNYPLNVPVSITPRQAKQALFLNGITSQMVEAAINQLPSPNKELAMIEWEYSTAFIRANPLVNQIGAVFGKTPAEIDAIWILGATL